ncbi:hypothetical protein [Nocardia cyriacigeorgica]|uniref:hypothetical protein n=1 Tax=Nocardia cyriacigeorgica TaxID=135487 RepID=UPI0002D37918|nr:hypothetical protein [Nocardia cyriacigeorgica]
MSPHQTPTGAGLPQRIPVPAHAGTEHGDPATSLARTPRTPGRTNETRARRWRTLLTAIETRRGR